MERLSFGWRISSSSLGFQAEFLSGGVENLKRGPTLSECELYHPAPTCRVSYRGTSGFSLFGFLQGVLVGGVIVLQEGSKVP